MKKLLSLFLLALMSLSFQTFAEGPLQPVVFQQGSDQNAVWGYVGFLPRVEDPSRVSITASKLGLTLRVHMILTRAEVENYANFLVKKSEQMEEVRRGELAIKQGDGSYTTPFDVYEKNKYDKYLNTIQEKVVPVVNAGFEANLELLKSFYGMNVTSSDENQVVFDMVYPISMQRAPWTEARVNAQPRAGVYTAHTIENRRTFHTPDASYIFAGFPALWFAGAIGFHGPIAYTTDAKMVSGADLPESDRADKNATKRWQLLRAPVSAGCMRMEHTNDLRNMLPTSAANAMKVKINVINTYDTVSTSSGVKVVGVKYYWFDVKKLANEAEWKKTFYGNKIPSNLLEYTYYNPEIVQLAPLAGSNKSLNPNATMNNLVRLPIL